MTDPRIEAAAREIWAEGVWDEYTERQKNARRRIVERAISAADDAAWRPIETAPIGNIILGHSSYSVPGYRNSDWTKPERNGLFFSNISPGIPISPQPTHWMPLPKPKKESDKQ